MAVGSRVTLPSYSFQDNRYAAVLMAGSACGFACMSALAHGLRNDLPWPIVAFMRCLVMAVMMGAILRYRRAPFVLIGDRTLWFRSLFGSLGMLSTFYSLGHLPVTDTVVIFAMSPLWITLILAGMGRFIPPLRIWVHIGLALGGVLIMQRPSFDAGSIPLLIAVAGSLSVAIAMVSLSLTRDYPGETVVMHFSLCSSCVTLAMSLSSLPLIHPDMLIRPAHLLFLLLIGITGTTSQLWMTTAYQKGHPTLVSLVGLTQIALGGLFDACIFHHAFDGWKLIGIGFIATGIAAHILQGRPAPAASPADS